MLNEAEIQRYRHHLSLDDIGLAGQERLKKSRILVVGCGGIGSPALLYLTAMGIGHIGIVDDDHVALSNLQRQVLFNTDDIGQPKVECALRHLNALNPHVEIKTYYQHLTLDQEHDFLTNYDLILDGSDNFQTRFLANALSLRFSLPLISASVLNYTYQVAIFNLSQQSPCLNCLYSEPPAAGTVQNCSEAGVLGIISGQAALLAVNLSLHYFMQKLSMDKSTLHCFNAQSLDLKKYIISKDPQCPICADFNWHAYQTWWQDKCVGQYDSSPLLNINAEHARTLLHQQHAIFVDIRSSQERARAAITPSAFRPNATVHDLQPWLAHNQLIVLYCQSGVRSLHLAQQVHQHHPETSVYSLQGGIDCWQQLSSSCHSQSV